VKTRIDQPKNKYRQFSNEVTWNSVYSKYEFIKICMFIRYLRKIKKILMQKIEEIN